MEYTGDRRIVVRSRVADGYHLTELGLKQIQHVFTDWFPRAVFGDLTEDTVRIDVVVRKGIASGRNVYQASFVRADGSEIKSVEYDEDRLGGKACESFDQMRSGYCGKKDGYDYRVLMYTPPLRTSTRR